MNQPEDQVFNAKIEPDWSVRDAVVYQKSIFAKMCFYLAGGRSVGTVEKEQFRKLFQAFTTLRDVRID